MQTIAAGAFGLAFPDLTGFGSLLVAANRTWPVIRLREQVVLEGVERNVPGDKKVVRLLEGHLELDRERRTVVAVTPRHLEPHDLIHPHLAVVGAIFGRWLGREAFHAGAFVVDGGAWALVGEKEGGKSTTLATCALAGHGIVTDDLLVVSGGKALAGPRCIDLRGTSAARLGIADQVVPARWGEKDRLVVPQVGPSIPLRGWIFLEWGDRVELRRLQPRDLLRRLPRVRTVQAAPVDPLALLDLIRLPAWRLTRPRSSSVLPQVLEALTEGVSA